MAEIAWSSVKIKRPLFPGTLNYSVLARDRGRERDMNVAADLENTFVLFQRCRFIVLRGRKHGRERE